MLHSTNSMLILYLPSEAWSSGKEISSSQRGELRFKFQLEESSTFKYSTVLELNYLWWEDIYEGKILILYLMS